MQPLRRFDFDASIVFSDILTIPEAMGLQLELIPEKGPVFHNPIRSEHDVAQLKVPNIEEDLGYVADAVAACVKEIDGKIPLIGFAGSPWTMATYMIEGQTSKTFKTIKSMLYRNPTCLQAVLQRLTDTIIPYLGAQADAGASALMVFDSWGGVLSGSTYRDFSLQYMQQIVQGMKATHPHIPVILFTKGGGQWLESMANTGCDALGLDWTQNIEDARQRVGDRVALQGNLDPFLLYATPERVQQAARNILTEFGPHNGHVFNLGHGIDKDTPIESVHALVEAVHNYRGAA